MLGKIQGAQILEFDILNEWVIVSQKAWLGKEGKMTSEDFFGGEPQNMQTIKGEWQTSIRVPFWRLSLVPFV